MSDLIVETVKIHKIENLPDSDNLQVAYVKGWKVIINKSTGYKVGDTVVYFPVDSILPYTWADKFGITKYLKNLPKSRSNYNTAGRIAAAKLRGFCSYGFITLPDREWEIGQNLKDYYNVEKYDPDPVFQSEESARPNSLFHKYTDIQNIKNFPGVFSDGELVSVTEKLHGANLRLGYVLEGSEKVFMVGSHNERKRTPAECKESNDKGFYWMPLVDSRYKGAIENLLTSNLFKDNISIILWGELVGKQDLKYGITNGNMEFYAFDISLDGKYLGYEEFRALCDTYKIPRVSELYVGPYYVGLIEEFTEGNTKLKDIAQIREGIVIKSLKEQDSNSGKNRLSKYNNGRKILKSISDGYTFRRGNKTENH